MSDTIVFVIMVVWVWLYINLKYLGVTWGDLYDWLYNKGFDLKRRKFIKWKK